MLAQPRTIRAAIERTERYISAGCPSRLLNTKPESEWFEGTLLSKMRAALDKAEQMKQATTKQVDK